jgi:hypothetical protein
VLVLNDRLRDVPPLPARERCAIGQIDVLAIQAVTLVEATELREHPPAQHQKAPEHPVGLHRLRGRRFVEVEVMPLRDDEAKRRPPHDGAGHRRKAAAGRLERAVGKHHLRSGDTALRIGLHERTERSDGTVARNRVRVGRDDEIAGRESHAPVDVRGEAERPFVVDGVDSRRQRAGDVRDHDELVDLRAQGGQRELELARMAMRDDDRRDLHASTRQ